MQNIEDVLIKLGLRQVIHNLSVNQFVDALMEKSDNTFVCACFDKVDDGGSRYEVSAVQSIGGDKTENFFVGAFVPKGVENGPFNFLPMSHEAFERDFVNAPGGPAIENYFKQLRSLPPRPSLTASGYGIYPKMVLDI
jgi:hypothetical protein